MNLSHRGKKRINNAPISLATSIRIMLVSFLISSVTRQQNLHSAKASAFATVNVFRKRTVGKRCISCSSGGAFPSATSGRGGKFILQCPLFGRSLTVSSSVQRKSLAAHQPGDNVANDNEDATLTMHNIYQQWSILDDYYLYQHRKEPIHKLASILGRGLRGIQMRLNKLTDVNSPAYERLFCSGKQRQLMSTFTYGGVTGNFNLNMEEDDCETVTTEKLTPAKDILRRIQWDASLTSSDFILNYYDRIADAILSVPFTTPNTSVKGQEELFVFAIPEHRITSVQYKERIVWDKEARLDLICGSGRRDSNDITVHDVIDTYDEWKHLNHEMKEMNLNRQREVVAKIKAFLGTERFHSLKESSDYLRRVAQIGGGNIDKDSDNVEDEIKFYVKRSYELFERAREEIPEEMNAIPTVPASQLESLELFSELVSSLPDENMRERILLEISIIAGRLTKQSSASESEPAPRVQLREEDLTEKFVKGSGAGGQKINKTSNRVILVHEPTQLRVECQETRSLQQNRKIGRKRLLEKLDIHVNGANSRFALKASKKSEKKIKAKARSKTRLNKKLEQRLEGSYSGDNDAYDYDGDNAE